MDREDVRDLPETQCQYFVLSPRPSLESPGRRPATGDENDDLNAANSQNIAKGLMKSFKKVATPRSTRKTPVRPSTPNRARPDPENVLTPHGCPVLLMTPEREEREEREEPAASLTSMSVCSETERESRLAQLAKRSTLRRHLSSKELEEMRVEQKRREVHELIQRNQVSCRRALNATDVGTAGRASTRPAKVTVPKEFNFSAPATPRTPRADLSICSDNEDAASLRSARPRGTPATVRRPTPTKWRPQLTVPKGPELRTTGRLSTCGSRRSLSCPPEDLDTSSEMPAEERVPSRPATPQRRRLEVYTAASRAERRAAAAGRAVAAPAAAPAAGAAAAAATAAARRPSDAEPAAARSAVGAPSAGAAASRAAGSSAGRAAARDRAEQARRLVQQRKDEEARAAQEVMCVFKRPAAKEEAAGAGAPKKPVEVVSAAPAAAPAPAAAERPRPLVNPPPGWSEGCDMLSVCSARSGASSARGTADLSLLGASTAERGQQARPRSARGPVPRPSFGSSAARPCLS